MKKSIAIFLILSLISGQCFAWGGGSTYRDDDRNGYSSMSYARFKEQNGIKTPVQRTFWDNAATVISTFAA
jgi:hypothetical protein